MSAPRVFLSYSHQDSADATELAEYLQRNGGDLFFDKWDILPGQSLVDRIFNDGLENSKFFIVLLSPSSVSSDWVKEELDSALIRRIEKFTTVVPVVLKQCRIPLPLRAIRWVDLTQNKEQGRRELVKLIHGYQDKPPVGKPPEFVAGLRESVRGLSREASTLGAFLARSTEVGHDSHRSFTGSQILEALPQLSEQDINDAVAELEDFGLVRAHKWLGTRPWRFGQVDPLYTLYLHFQDDGLSYKPEDDIRKVAIVVSTQDQWGAQAIADQTGLPPARVNRAVSYLDDYGLVTKTATLGTAPFDFAYVLSSHRTRRFVGENC